MRTRKFNLALGKILSCFVRIVEMFTGSKVLCLELQKDLGMGFSQLKNTHREKAPSNETAGLIKSTNMGIWVVGTTNQLFIRGSYTETKFSKK